MVRRLVLTALTLLILVMPAPATATPANGSEPLGMGVTDAGVRRMQSSLVPHELRLRVAGRLRTVTLWLAEGFAVNVFADGIDSARMLAESPTGEFVVTTGWDGKVLKLTDKDRDGRADDVVPIMFGLQVPHGVVFAGDEMLVAETHRVLRLPHWWDGASARPIIELDGGGHHATRSLAVGSDGALYVSTGSTCDVCVEADARRAAVWRYTLDGGDGAPFARGLRNAVGLALDPASGHLWATDNERKALGDEIPPDEVNVLRAGGDFGWPACWGRQEVNPELGSVEGCAATEAPALELPAHSAPLGLDFVRGDAFPPAYRGGLLIALHGSAARSEAVGYSVVFVPVVDGKPEAAHEFMRGWLVGDDSWGRPVAPFFGRDGSLYLTDDKAGAIYRVTALPTRVAAGS